MLRRQFLNISALAAVAALAPVTLNAKDYRADLPDVWTATSVDDAVKAMYGSKEIVRSGVTLNMPAQAADGMAVPIHMTSELNAKSLSVFQDSNPEAAVAAFTIHEGAIINYNLKIKLKNNGKPVTVTAIVEGHDGKLYATSGQITVAQGCEG